jgi:hypothetical protein
MRTAAIVLIIILMVRAITVVIPLIFAGLILAALYWRK